MPHVLLDIAEIDERILIVRTNLTESIEQAAAYSGAADEELYAGRIAEQDTELKDLITRREQLLDNS